MERWKQNLINSINMLPLNQESLDLLKEMVTRYIKEQKLHNKKILQDKIEELEYQLSKEKFKNTTPKQV